MITVILFFLGAFFFFRLGCVCEQIKQETKRRQRQVDVTDFKSLRDDDPVEPFFLDHFTDLLRHRRRQ